MMGMKGKEVGNMIRGMPMRYLSRILRAKIEELGWRSCDNNVVYVFIFL